MEKIYVTTRGFELGLSAQVTSSVTTTPLRMTENCAASDNKKSFNWVCLLAFRCGLGSNLLGSPFNIAIKK